MPKITILDRYVAREVFAPFGLGVALLTFALVTGKLLKLTDMVVNHGVSIGEVVGLMAFIMPAFLELTFPMAVLLGVLLGFGRMSGDREMIAARACGVSLYRIAVPVMMVALVVYALSSWFAFSIRPWANISLEQRLFYLTRTRVSAVLREKVFNSGFKGMVVYVDKVSAGGDGLQGVMISDARTAEQQNTIIARHGVLIPDERSNQLTLRLFDGSIFGVDIKNNASHVTSFNTYDLAIKPGEDFGATWLSPDEMSYPILLAAIRNGRASGKRNYEAETELARKYMIPIASLLFAMLGISLGLKPARGGQSERFGVSVALFFFYYSLMRVGQTLGERGVLNAFIAMAIPDLVFVALALWLFVRAAEDLGNEGRGPGDVLWDLIERYERSPEHRMTIRPRLSPTVDRFLAGTFFGPFMVCLAAFTAAYLLGDIFDRFDTLVHRGGLGVLGLEYFALKLPLIVTQLLPIACLAGVLLGFALLNRTGEVLACQQLGISRVEMMIPVLLIGALISGFQFVLSETVVPAAAREAKYLYEVQLKGRQLEGVFANRHLWMRVRDGFLSADTYDRKKMELAGITLYRLGPDFAVTNIFHADDAYWNGQAWVPRGVTRYRLSAGSVSSSEPPGFVINITPADLGLLRLEPEEFSIWELNRYIHDLKKKGLDPGGYLVDRDLKYAMPLSCLIMVALGIALSLDPLPRHLSLGRSFGLAILIGFGYWLAAGLTSSLGHSGFMPAWFAAWSPNLLFTMLASGIFLFGEER